MRVIVVIIPDVLTADVSSVSFKRAILAPLFLRDEEGDSDCAVGGVGSAGLSSLRTSNLSLAPIFVYDTPLIYLYKIITVRV